MLPVLHLLWMSETVVKTSLWTYVNDHQACKTILFYMCLGCKFPCSFHIWCYTSNIWMWNEHGTVQPGCGRLDISIAGRINSLENLSQESAKSEGWNPCLTLKIARIMVATASPLEGGRAGLLVAHGRDKPYITSPPYIRLLGSPARRTYGPESEICPMTAYYSL